jgi:hypothetical protein
MEGMLQIAVLAREEGLLQMVVMAQRKRLGLS